MKNTATTIGTSLGEDTPTGVAGSFGGSIDTGAGLIDPYERNASRTVTDVTVPGALVPLTYTRIWNARSSYGYGGGWSDNWQWGFNLRWNEADANPPIPANDRFLGYTVSYPDGRVINFLKLHAHDPPGIAGNYFMGGGISDYLEVVNTIPANPNAAPVLRLHKKDGGIVTWTFAGTYDLIGEIQRIEVTDPHGLTVTITGSYYFGPFTPIAKLITEPGGKWIRIDDPVRNTATHTDTSTLTTSAGQNITYTCPYDDVTPGRFVYGDPYAVGGWDNIKTIVVTVRYDYFTDPPTNAAAQATYVYKAVQPKADRFHNPNAPDPPPFYRLYWASDPMFDGPLKTVKYTYHDGMTTVIGDLTRTAIKGVSYKPGPMAADPETMVDQVEILNCTYSASTGNSPGCSERVETRGDGGTRTISYRNLVTGYEQHSVDHVTDFTNNPSIIEKYEYTFNGSDLFPTPTKVTDMRGIVTLQELTADIGQVKKMTHVADGSFASWEYQSPGISYYLASRTDENLHKTSFTRDPQTHRVTRIDYPDSGFEIFDYNIWGQVISHQLTSGGVEGFAYDPSTHLKTSHTAPATPSVPTPSPTTYQYYVQGDGSGQTPGLLKSETDPLGNTTTYLYNGRQQIVRVTHADTKYLQNQYNSDGTLNWTADEEHPGAVTDASQRLRYLYDEYKRVVSITEPKASTSTTKDYTPNNASGSVTRLSRCEPLVTHEVSAAGKIVDQGFDVNLRLTWKRLATGTSAVATTNYAYDAVGNLLTEQDPRGNTTTYDYDSRNRKHSKTPPNPFSDQVTIWDYDYVGNMTMEHRPDGTFRQLEYDNMNRAQTEHQPRKSGRPDITTVYSYFQSGMLKSVQDAISPDYPAGHTTSFTYDARNLKATMKYPNDQTVSGWFYDANDNLLTRPTADSAQRQTFQYDNRNRVVHMRWNNGIDFSDFGYDGANRIISAINPWSTITRRYDDAGRLALDQQSLAVAQNAAAITVQPISVVSRLTHGSAGVFDIDLPLSGNPGVECRSTSGQYSIVLTFNGSPIVGGARVISGTGTVASVSVSNSVMTVNLTNVADAQRMAVKVYGIDLGGVTNAEVNVPVQVLVGDSTGDGTISAGDISQVQSRSGQSATTANFRSDVNANGSISASDLNLVKSRSGIGIPATLAGPVVAVKYEHDADGRMQRVYGSDPAGNTVGYDYSYGFDPVGRLQDIFADRSTSPSFQYQYDNASNLTTRSDAVPGISQVFGYDQLNRINSCTLNAQYLDTSGARHPYTFSQERYSHDPMSRLAGTGRTLTGPDTVPRATTENFGYNDNAELISATYGTNHSVSYTLDAAGNRNGVNGVLDVYNGTPRATTYTPNSLNQYSNLATNGSVHQILLDQNMNQYAYLGDTRLASVSQGTGLYELGYDALGRCVRRSTNRVASSFIYHGEKPIIEFNASNAVTARNVYGPGMDELVARNTGLQVYMLQDHLGSVAAVTDSSGQVMEQYRYDAFGLPEFHSGPVLDNPGGDLRTTTMVNNRFLFTGREWVQAYGFYEYRARAYSPTLGRFMSEDPTGLQVAGAKPSLDAMHLIPAGQLSKTFAFSEANMFRYCHNDPVDKTDPLGLYIVIEGSAGYIKRVLSDLSAIRGADARLAGMVDKLVDSDRRHLITDAKGSGNKYSPGNGNSREQGWLNSMRERFHMGTGSTTYYDPNNARGWRGLPRDPKAGLVHELGHALDRNNGTISKTVNPLTHTGVAQERAIWWENIMRGYTGDPWRSGDN